MDSHRAQRISEALRKELAELIEYELNDPRLAGVTVTNVQVTPDLKHAHISVEPKPAVEALEHAATFLRRAISARLRLYRVPELHFELDDPDKPAARIEELLDRVRRNREKNVPPPEK
ncbi:MAG TPA: 30S ribosome-binding factor RbfA [Bryobacteraceae bacterium]|nr:30S ribosome-binding factor RbfA [Bryobacteraceae bacterium]